MIPAPLRRLWATLFFGAVHEGRTRFFTRAALALLALDCWLIMVPHGGRYGAGGFNVSHFNWLDHLQPDPTRALYGALLLSSGALSLTAALGVIRRSTLVWITLLYTWAWAMSQLDSYQHHYYLSLVLICLSCSSAPGTRGAGMSRDWGWNLLLFTSGLVYLFTTIAKLEPAWREG